jgi:hypothetical protein
MKHSPVQYRLRWLRFQLYLFLKNHPGKQYTATQLAREALGWVTFDWRKLEQVGHELFYLWRSGLLSREGNTNHWHYETFA